MVTPGVKQKQTKLESTTIESNYDDSISNLSRIISPNEQNSNNEEFDLSVAENSVLESTSIESVKKTVTKIVKDYVLVLDSSDSFGDSIVGGVSYFCLIQRCWGTLDGFSKIK